MMANEVDLSKLKVAELKMVARIAGIKTSGSKTDLIRRIQQSDNDDIVQWVEKMRNEYAEGKDDDCADSYLEEQVAKLSCVVEQLTKQLHEIQASAGKRPDQLHTSSPELPLLHTALPSSEDQLLGVQQMYGVPPLQPVASVTLQSQDALPLSVAQPQSMPFSAPQPVYMPRSYAALPYSAPHITYAQQTQSTIPFSMSCAAMPPHLNTTLAPNVSQPPIMSFNTPYFQGTTPGNVSQPLSVPSMHGPLPHTVMQPNVVPSRYMPQSAEVVMQTMPERRREHYHSLKDIRATLPEFDPSDDSYTSLQFIQRIEQLCEVYRWDETLLVFAVLGQLKGVAKKWADAQQVFRTWSEFVKAFTEDFPDVSNSADAHIKLMNAKIRKGEKIVDYFYRMVAIGRRENIDDVSLCRYIITGLTDERMRTTLSAIHFDRCTDLLRSMTNMTSSSICASNNLSNPSSNQNHKYQKHENSKVSYDNHRTVSNDKSEHGPICFNCRQRGHISRNCPKPQRKDKVNVVNAEEPICANEMDISKPNINNVVDKSRPRELLKTVKIIGGETLECTALIDSGSSKSLIKKTLAHGCVLEKVACCNKLIGFAGGEIVCSEKVKAKICFNEVVYDAELLVIDDDVLKYDLLVGIDILSKGTVIIENGECTVLSIDSESLKVGETVSELAVQKLINVLDEYSHCFGEKLCELGRSNNFKMNISLTSSKPIVKRPYPIPIPKQHTVETIVKELMMLNIIRPSNSLYASPIVLVKKQNGEDRLCVDFRELNAITEKQPWLMPTVDGVLGLLKGKRFFTTLDLMSGYYQLELEESSKPYTAFVTHNGHYEFNRMPFGLRNAPCAFQRMMTKLIAPLGKGVVNYVDEVIIATDSEHENISYLIELLKLIEQEGLTLRLSKCTFLQESVAFLGHEVNSSGIQPGSIKTNAIKNYSTPQNALEVRRFLGLAGFFRKFVVKFAEIAQPLTGLTKKNATFIWTTECDKAFNTLICMLTNAPILCMYDMTKEHQLHCDASSTGIAAIMLQKEGDNFKPVAYFSRVCSATEKNYHAYELEVMAVVEGCERFKMYLIGKPFTIITDCKAISSAKITKPMLPRVARWFLRLLEFDFEIIHRSGEKMRHVDAISRAPSGIEESTGDVTTKIMNINNEDWVSMLQRQDLKIQHIVAILSGRQQSDQKTKIKNEFCLQKDRLWRKSTEGKLLLVVPNGVRWKITKMYHDDVGHPGVDGTIKRIVQNFWFSRMRNYVKGFIQLCIECSYHREPGKKGCELHGMEVPKVPFHTLHMDHLGPFIKSRHGNVYILVIIDALTRYTIVTATKTTKAKPAVDALSQLTAYFGLPHVVVTDRGTAFTSNIFEIFCTKNNIKHIKVAVRTPRANGLAERANQTILTYLKTSTTDQKDWDNHIRMLQWSLNTKINATTKKAPIDLIFDFPLRDLSGNKLLAAVQDDCHLHMNKRREEATSQIEQARQRWKNRFDAKYAKPQKYEEGDLVLIEAPCPNTGESRKLQPKYKGPYAVTKVLRFDRYVVEEVEGLQQSKRRYSTITASDKMKPWCALAPELEDKNDDEMESDEEDQG